MAMRTASPWWASLGFGLGLILMFVGERVFGHLDGPRYLMTGVGVGLLIAVTGARAWAMMGSTGARRNVERTLVLCHLGTLLALVLYALSTSWGLGVVGVADTAVHFRGALTVLYIVLLVASIVPVVMLELSLGIALRTNFDLHGDDEDATVEYYRVRDIGWSGLSLALASAFLMVTCQVANERNIQRDVSYFKTSSPGESTRNIVGASNEPLKALLFFPDPNEVKDQVKDYFDALSTSGKLTVEVHDHLVDAELASKYKVTKDGVVVVVRGTGDKEKSQTIDLDTDIEKARKGAGKLRNLDREVNSILMKLVRDKRKAYLMTGHGEINDPESIPLELKGRVEERRTTVFKKRLADLNYEVKELGLIDLAKDVPDDATVVIVLAPTVPLQSAEWDALSRYLDRGGRLLYALDPLADPSLGSLEGKFGLKYDPDHLTDAKAFLPQRGSIADHRFVITTQFSAHASTTQLSRAVDKGLVVIDSGALLDEPFTGKGEQPKKTFTIRSMDTSFLDYNANFLYDPQGIRPEKQQHWNIAAALEGPKTSDGKDGYRALVFADVDLFRDVIMQSMGRAAVVMVSGPLLDDSIRWLGGEEVFSGEVVSEDDKPIQHTKSQDGVWFTLTILGAPLLVLGIGLFGTWARRRRAIKVVTP
jgi:ABC-type uncharacterized transport system